MKKRKLFKKRKRKSKEVVTEKVTTVSTLKKYSNKLKNYHKKIKKKHKERITLIKKFFLIIFGYGLIINYSLYLLFPSMGIKFNLLTIPAWGIIYYFISDEFVEWFRRLIKR